VGVSGVALPNCGGFGHRVADGPWAEQLRDWGKKLHGPGKILEYAGAQVDIPVGLPVMVSTENYFVVVKR